VFRFAYLLFGLFQVTAKPFTHIFMLIVDRGEGVGRVVMIHVSGGRLFLTKLTP